jgi:hypothetical protein
VVSAVREGVLTIEEACHRYNLSIEEFHAWEQGLSRHGLRGLQATRVGQFRPRLLPIASD